MKTFYQRKLAKMAKLADEIPYITSLGEDWNNRFAMMQVELCNLSIEAGNPLYKSRFVIFWERLFRSIFRKR